MTGIPGTWDVAIKTPIGSLAVEYVFTADGDGLSGTATLRGDTVALVDIAVDGDQLTGHSRAGRLPRSAVSGTRRRG